jgi:hypothetical protein
LYQSILPIGLSYSSITIQCWCRVAVEAVDRVVDREVDKEVDKAVNKEGDRYK